MPKDMNRKNAADIRAAAERELRAIRQLGEHSDLVAATANLSAYEALLYIICAGEPGVPVYKAVESVKSRYSSQSGVINRLKAMRRTGLLEERPGRKKSQVYLAPSEKLMAKLGPILLEKFEK